MRKKLEAQEYMEQGLERRSRFYQAKKESKHLKRGEKNWKISVFLSKPWESLGFSFIYPSKRSWQTEKGKK